MSQRDQAASRREVNKRLIAVSLGGAALSIVGPESRTTQCVQTQPTWRSI